MGTARSVEWFAPWVYPQKPQFGHGRSHTTIGLPGDMLPHAVNPSMTNIKVFCASFDFAVLPNNQYHHACDQKPDG